MPFAYQAMSYGCVDGYEKMQLACLLLQLYKSSWTTDPTRS